VWQGRLARLTFSAVPRTRVTVCPWPAPHRTQQRRAVGTNTAASSVVLGVPGGGVREKRTSLTARYVSHLTERGAGSRGGRRRSTFNRARRPERWRDRIRPARSPRLPGRARTPPQPRNPLPPSPTIHRVLRNLLRQFRRPPPRLDPGVRDSSTTCCPRNIRNRVAGVEPARGCSAPDGAGDRRALRELVVPVSGTPAGRGGDRRLAA